MRKLFYGLILVVMLSQFPQVSAQFQEEKQGIDAAYGKVTKAIDFATTAYTTTRKDVGVIQGRLDRTKQDIDKGVTYAQKAGTEASKYSGAVKSLVGEAKAVTQASMQKVTATKPVAGTKTVTDAASQK